MYRNRGRAVVFEAERGQELLLVNNRASSRVKLSEELPEGSGNERPARRPILREERELHSPMKESSMFRSASKVILSALDAPRSSSFGALLKSRPGNRLQREQSEIPEDSLTRALLQAIRDMQILVGHVHALLDGLVAEEAGIIK